MSVRQETYFELSRSIFSSMLSVFLFHESDTLPHLMWEGGNPFFSFFDED